MLSVILNLSPRSWHSFLFVCAAALMAYAKYSEAFLDLVPCPLCMTQQVAFILVVITSLIAIIHNPVKLGVTVYSGLCLFFSVVGASVATRQVYIENLPPDQMPSCGPPLEYIIDALPMSDVLHSMFVGGGSCGVIQWEFLGITMAGYAFLWFSLLVLVSGFNIWKVLTGR